MPTRSRPARPGTRGPGRPTAAAAGDGDAGGSPRERLLDAATLLFSRHGVAGTPIKAIAAEAGVTPALVHYYFRDRDQLLDAVVDERLQPLVEQVFPNMPPVAEPGAPAPDIVAMMTGLAAQLIRVASATPWLPGLWIREIVGAEGQLRERVVQRIALRRGALVTGLLAAARERGDLNPGLEPPLVMVSLIGLTLLPLATTHIWRGLPGADAIDTETLVRHVGALLARGLAPG
ncbi:TetR/AcrR family transcriptional regulator [Cupriavidus pauculus]|uniref:TetR/AcrR family transcriptional regulator n=1 Tax=Cupriavidus pauculus TaxID=82633 RepID=A0A5P2H598_9BURK|nr:TetR/AcrR family transcriptional regulator [Cupriavidus pauculus]QET02824.1 TetR/AcrR family transcriptional regulator [Cupriavidus pauculus]